MGLIAGAFFSNTLIMTLTQNQTLLNDVILKSGLIQHIGYDKPIEWFKELTFKRIFFIIIVPLICIIIIAFILKSKYEAKKRKDAITLNGFYKYDD